MTVTASFEEIYRTQHRRVYSICLKMLRNEAEAEDLTQEVFFQVYRKIDSFRGESKLSTWLHRLTVNQVLMHMRANRRRRQHECSVWSEDETGREFNVLEDLCESNQGLPADDRMDLEKAVTGLARGYRSVLILHDLLGCEQEEVAKLLGVSVGTCKSQSHKARKRVKKMLGNRANPRPALREAVPAMYI
jgi:RNA polymerase sigma-70 factor (ECF subfamily)